MKSFEVPNPVLTALQGVVATSPHLALVESDKVVFRVPDSENKVAVISGGGAGHEPTHAGFVGAGCLTGAVSGEIFASPSTKQILNGIKILSKNSTKGVLLIVKNYTGDVLHFGLAGERARALGIDTEVVVIGDDVAVGRSKGGLVGRRAIAGTLFVHKIVGAFVEYYESHTLKQAAELARAINENVVTIGASLDHAKVPGHQFESGLNEQQMELGMGIHNEPGVKVLSPIPTVSDLLKDQILPKLLDPKDADRAFVPFSTDDDIILLVNNLGGISNLILSGITKTVLTLLEAEYGIKPVRTYNGTMMTALNGEGFSVTLLNASRTDSSLKNYPFKSIVELLDAPTDAPGWPVKQYNGSSAPTYDPKILEEGSETVTPVGKFDSLYFKTFLEAGVNNLVKAEPYITKLDTQVGDGDCGTTLVSGGEGLIKNFDSIPTSSLSEALHQISDLVETFMGGTSGGLYSIFITGLADAIITSGDQSEITKESLSKGLAKALNTLYKYTNARCGDSTVIDALEPFIKVFSETLDFDKAVIAADKGAQSTASLEAKFGRASYVGESSSIPDPGAVGLVEFLKGVQSAL